MSAVGTLATVARALNRGARRRALRPLVFLTDIARTPDPVAVVAAWPRALATMTLVIFRHYEHPDRAALAARLARECRARRVPLLIAADPALAAKVGAAGVHWPDGLFRSKAGAPVLPRRFLQTAAAHDARGLARAAGADALLLSPVFATESHAGARTLGTLRFTALVRGARAPVYALGGLKAANARRLLGSGAIGLAAIGALQESVSAAPSIPENETRRT